ncbi:hypothetical protein J132_03499 [Termitomyces sp. J132]|nr:hypothetical protein J132_03499 [Termitomyces sp. J132]
MPSLTSPFHKLPTTLHTATALPAAPSELLCHVALFNHSVKQSGNNAIVAVLHNPAFASALLGHISTAKALLFGAADHTHFISAVNMVHLVILISPFLSTHIPQFFVDQVDFPWITEQQGLFDTLSLLLTSKILDCSIGDNSTMAKAFFSFADAVIQIEGNHCEACKKELDKVCPSISIFTAQFSPPFTLQQLQHYAQDKDITMLGPSASCPSKYHTNISPALKLDSLACCFDMLAILITPSQADLKSKP